MEELDIKSLTLEELTEEFKKQGMPAFRAKQVFEWLHVKLVDGFDDMTNLSKELRSTLKEKYPITLLSEVDALHSETDGTIKYLFRLNDNRVIESVLMKYHHGNSVCISSQVGCRMGCKFCASTLGGKERDLLPSEMLDQIYRIQVLSGERVSNVVVMGTGEPLDNYDNLIRFLKILTDSRGLNISARNITVSTCGIPDKIRAFAEEGMSITLALSLHAPNNEIRKKLMPVASKYSLEEVMEAFIYYYEKTGRRLTFEYSLVEGVNDEEEHAKELSRLIKGINCHVNLIPVNPIKERNYKKSESKKIQIFKNTLEKNRINVTIRREMGADINAACGQLRKSYIDNCSV
ncbi:23S rRNA (adenine(2503)-C(2))-methyltransferase RlmN [Lachnospiraceae bacterium MD1]|uniref:Probable dual-specificity RNA methyltransferase RlmN n=1 Tax=Variimorphobacter saccharofermentans TaxID=2755051 RepID=A0A839JZ95_9FIRM|nr:23S rRNA (adenine(2503)-C(2))-methyltransferase RlmN [Variimorphobacter saccharofermentans]MBB2182696.1 23S rRNA (adenine(2503)-C(2))-methyltransferase RlmN [Variimorphobacter saccharofermentans]